MMRTQEQILKNLRYIIASSRNDATVETAAEALEEIERLETAEARIKELETSPYSAAQLAEFEAQCYSPSQAILWHHLPEVPEIPPTEHRVNVWGCIVREGFEECTRVQYLDINGQQYWQDRNGDGTITVRCFIELPTQAPPKPEGQLAPLELGKPEPQKCQHAGHNWDAVYRCRGCGEIVPEEMAREVEAKNAKT